MFAHKPVASSALWLGLTKRDLETLMIFTHFLPAVVNNLTRGEGPGIEFLNRQVFWTRTFLFGPLHCVTNRERLAGSEWYPAVPGDEAREIDDLHTRGEFACITLNTRYLVGLAPTITRFFSPVGTFDLNRAARLLSKTFADDITRLGIDPNKIPAFIRRLQRYTVEFLEYPVEEEWFSSIVGREWWNANVGRLENRPWAEAFYRPTTAKNTSQVTKLKRNVINLFTTGRPVVRKYLQKLLGRINVKETNRRY